MAARVRANKIRGKLADMPPSEQSEEEKLREAQQLTLWGHLRKVSRNLIYGVMMRGGGEPFGAPFERGMQSLDERVVKKLHQRSFFSFESLEKLRRRRERNKFTRHGAAPYRGPYQFAPRIQASRGVVERFIRYLRENRFFMFVPPQDDNDEKKR